MLPRRLSATVSAGCLTYNTLFLALCVILATNTKLGHEKMMTILLEFIRTLLEAVSVSVIVSSVSPGTYRAWRVLSAVFGAGLVFALVTNSSGWMPMEFNTFWVKIAVVLGLILGVLAFAYNDAEAGNSDSVGRAIVISGSFLGLTYSALAVLKAPHLSGSMAASLINVSPYVFSFAGGSFLLMLMLSVKSIRFWSPVIFSILPMCITINMWQLLPLVGSLLFGASSSNDIVNTMYTGNVKRRILQTLILTLSLTGVTLINIWMFLIARDLLGSPGMFSSPNTEIHGLSILLSIPFFSVHGRLCRWATNIA